MTTFRHLTEAVGRLRAILGTPGLMIGLFSLLSFVFGLFMVVREYNRPRQNELRALHKVLSNWVRAPNYLGSTLIDYVDRWRQAPPDQKEAGRADLVAALQALGDELEHHAERFPLLEIVSLAVVTRGDPPVARWDSPDLLATARSDLIADRIPLIASGDGPAVALLVRYRIEPTLERAVAELETSYHRLLLALLGLSGFSLLFLGYMILHAQALRERVAREAAQEATLDLADRTCHELGNGVFVLANERRNLAQHLDLIDRFVAQESEARAAAARTVGMDPDLFARWNHALEREYATRGIAPELELSGSAALARDVCRQLAVCFEYIALTVRELDGFLKRTALPVELGRVSVADCLDEALALLGPRLEAVDTRIDRQIDGEMIVRADRRLLVHALVNLLKNAVEAAAGAGTPPRITLGARVEGGTAWISVADNGPGIPEASLARVFEEGYSTKGTGRGRGLAIVKESVHVQGGVIKVANQPGGGAEFRIGLPVE